jgi:hypothetical protein
MFGKVNILALIAMLNTFLFSVTAYTPQFADDGQKIPLHWKSKTINVFFSASLKKPAANIKPESDITGAVERSLKSWESVANINFVVKWTDKNSISPSGGRGDGISLITVADTPENLVPFANDDGDLPGRTRVFFNQRGEITEADIVINPYQQFSTDGTNGTFDLESTLTHELGHFLGLDHSTVAGATMQPFQGQNGIYSLPVFSMRSLSEDDLAGIRSLYGASLEPNCCGSVSGNLKFSDGKLVAKAKIWLEESNTGRLTTGLLTKDDGSFKIDGLTANKYRLLVESMDKTSLRQFQTIYLGDLEIEPGKTVFIEKQILEKSKKPKPSYIGFNGQLSSIPLPLTGENYFVVYIGGENINFNFSQKNAITTSSPFLKINPNSITKQDFGNNISVYSFEILVNKNIPLGDYSLQITNFNGETANLTGVITIDGTINPWPNKIFNF